MSFTARSKALEPRKLRQHGKSGIGDIRTDETEHFEFPKTGDVSQPNVADSTAVEPQATQLLKRHPRLQPVASSLCRIEAQTFEFG